MAAAVSSGASMGAGLALSVMSGPPLTLSIASIAAMPIIAARELNSSAPSLNGPNTSFLVLGSAVYVTLLKLGMNVASVTTPVANRNDGQCAANWAGKDSPVAISAPRPATK